VLVSVPLGAAAGGGAAGAGRAAAGGSTTIASAGSARGSSEPKLPEATPGFAGGMVR
jgi:hypothetical protein